MNTEFFDSVAPVDRVLTNPLRSARERANGADHSKVHGEVLRLPARADPMFRLKSFLTAGAAVLAARLVAALFARR